MGGACIVVHWCVWSGTGGFTQAPAYRRLREEVGWVSSGLRLRLRLRLRFCLKLLVYKISLKLPTKTILSTAMAGEGAAASWVV